MKRRMLLFCLLVSASLYAQLPAPEDFFGFRMGADYRLAAWDRIVEYFKTLDEASDRMEVSELGKSTEGNPLILAVISSRENLIRIDEIKRAARRMTDVRGLNSEGARALARQEKILVLITCSIHATEVGAAQAMPELVHDLLSNDTPENREILDNVVFLLVPSFNPDGLVMVKDWYDQYVDTEFEGGRMPWLYQLYTGHDNNRDAIMLTQVESQMINRILYHDWLPPVYLDMHQMGNRGFRIFVPPYINPLNPNIHPLIVWENALFGEGMALDLEAAGKSGVGTSAAFTGWWQGAFLMTAMFHNTIGLLTELASCRVATPVFLDKQDLSGGRRGFPSYQKVMNFPNPWPGGWWRLRDIVEYDLIAAKSVLMTAARNRERVLYNRYLMCKQAVEAGKSEPPYAFVVPRIQTDWGTACRMIDVLLAGGVEVHRAKGDFEADDIPYGEGSFVVLMAQPFRPFAKDVLEPQAYPDIRESAGGPPIRPYDMAGWTLPLQMGVKAVPVTRSFDAELERIQQVPTDETDIPSRAGWGFVLSHAENHTFIVVNRLLSQGANVYWTTGPIAADRSMMPPGTILVPRRYQRDLRTATEGLSVTVKSIERTPRGDFYLLKPVRLGLYKPWTSSMQEGWNRWLLERYEFPFRSVLNEEFRAGNLVERYDAIVIPDMRASGIVEGREPGTIPPAFAEGIGSDGVAHMKAFVEAGGVLITIDEASELVMGDFGLPVRNALDGVPADDFYCPGSILGMEYDNTHPVAYGMEKSGIGFFARSRAYRVLPNFQVEAKTVAKYPSKRILKSGYLLGEGKIANRASVVDVPLGKGRVILIGFDPVNRIHAQATFKLLFNAILLGGAGITTL